jgi:hypothetical protein
MFANCEGLHWETAYARHQNQCRSPDHHRNRSAAGRRQHDRPRAQLRQAFHATTYANGDVLLIGASEPLSGTEAFFEIEVGPHGITRLICGNGIILGSLPDGEKVAARTPLLAVRVRFVTPAEAYVSLPERGFIGQ